MANEDANILSLEAVFGNALLLQMANNRKILALPPEIDFKGTMIMVRIPAQVPEGFNFYTA
jgi:hypothetical protein